MVVGKAAWWRRGLSWGGRGAQARATAGETEAGPRREMRGEGASVKVPWVGPRIREKEVLEAQGLISLTSPRAACYPRAWHVADGKNLQANCTGDRSPWGPPGNPDQTSAQPWDLSPQHSSPRPAALTSLGFDLHFRTKGLSPPPRVSLTISYFMKSGCHQNPAPP